MTYASEVTADAPVTWLTFDQAGSTITDTGSTPRTVSQFGSPSKVTGVSGTGLSFSGSNTQYLSLASLYNFGSDLSYSIEVWFKSTQSTGLGTFLRRDSNGAVLFRLNAGRVEFYHNNGSAAMSTGTYADGNWHHAVAVRTGSTTTVLYVDGVQVATGAATTHTQTTSVATFVGTNSSVGDEVFAGTMDELAFYDTALSSTRVGAHYTAGLASLPDKTVQAQAAVLNLTSPAPVVTAIDENVQTLYVTADKSNAGTSDATATTISFGSGATSVIFAMPTPVLTGGATLTSAKLRLFATQNTAVGTFNVKVYDPNSTWSEANFHPVGADTGLTGTISAGWNEIDITSIVQSWIDGSDTNFGIRLALQGTVTGVYLINSHENAANKPYLSVSAPIPHVDAICAVGAAAELTLDAPFQRFGVSTTISTNSYGELTLSAPGSFTVTTTSNILVQANVAILSLTAPEALSRNPDFTLHPEVAEMWLFVGEPTVIGGHDGGGVATVTELTLSAPDPALDFQTDAYTYAQTVTMTLAAVGIFIQEGDRYFNVLPGTLDYDDIWLPLDEVSGTTAFDFNTFVEANGDFYDSNGTYVGGPVLSQEGPQLRRAVHFDGIDDRVQMGPYRSASTFSSGMDVTVEFSIKTTDLNGTIIDGIDNTNAYSTSEVRLVDGQIVLYNGSQFKLSWPVRKFVSDGQWHHVVISMPTGSSLTYDAYNISASANPYFVMIDGVVEWARYGAQMDGRFFIPQTVMARSDGSNAVEGDLSHIVVRTNYAISENTAATIYYEWANAVVIRPEAAVLTLSAVHPTKAEGNMPKMLALYGLPYYLESGFNQPSTRDGFGNYYSVFAGYFIRTDAVSLPLGLGGSFVPAQTFSNGIPMVYFRPKPFTLEGYLVYPTAIHHQAGSNGGPFSADGVENGLYIDPITGEFIDDRTGLPRFIDLDLDLSQDIKTFDAITAVNYPAATPDDGQNPNSDFFREPRQHNLGLTNTEWAAARDKLRDSILRASQDDGVNLWIPEPHMAEHLGFIGGWVKHDTGARVEFYGPGNVDATGYTNKRAEYLDDIHIDETQSGGQNAAKVAAQGVGQFNFTWQANAKRKVIATEPGLTDHASYEMVERIEYNDDAAWALQGEVVAYDIVDRTDGLIVGDELVMAMWSQDDYTGNYPAFNTWSVGNPRKYIVSAYPDGIVGKPITKEMDSYYGVNGVLKANPWRDNIYTIAAERGSIVRGRPIKGRAFMEFMDPDVTRVKIGEDKDKSKWNGETGKNISSWSFDTRRYREVIIITLLERQVQRSPTTLVVLKDEQRYVDREDIDVILQPFMSMNARGLNWLKEASDIPEGEARVYVSSATMNLSATDASLSIDKNMNFTVVGTARLDLSAPVPDSVDDPNVVNKVLPAVMNLEARGTGKVIRPEVATLTLSTPDASGVGAGDNIYLYVDAGTTITLFLKED